MKAFLEAKMFVCSVGIIGTPSFIVHRDVHGNHEVYIGHAEHYPEVGNFSPNAIKVGRADSEGDAHHGEGEGP